MSFFVVIHNDISLSILISYETYTLVSLLKTTKTVTTSKLQEM